MLNGPMGLPETQAGRESRPRMIQRGIEGIEVALMDLEDLMAELEVGSANRAKVAMDQKQPPTPPIPLAELLGKLPEVLSQIRARIMDAKQRLYNILM